MGFADYSGVLTNQAFDYNHGNAVWKEKLDHLKAWLAAHVADSAAMRKPLVIEEFGKASARFARSSHNS